MSAPAVSAATGCYHCGLPVPAGSRWTARVLDETRAFCCGGCLAIAEEISAAGLADYYRLRTQPASPPASRLPSPDEVLFDREELQASFVRAVGDHRRASLLLEGIRCPACLWVNEQRLKNVPGVVEAHVAYASRRATVTWDPRRVKLSEILRSVSEIGYQARPFDASHRAALEEEAVRRDGARLIFAGVVGMMVMNLALATYFLGTSRASGARLPLWETFARWGSLVASVLLLAYPGKDFFVGAWRDLRNRRAGMDLPVVLGLVAAWTGSAWATWRGSGPVYFDAIAMLVFFVLLARAAETRARLSAAESLDAYAEVRLETARRVRDDGSEDVVPTLDLSPGELVSILPGETAPADGTLVLGSSAFDESILTGEPWPKARGPGDAVVAGSCNLDQPVRMRVTRAGDASTISEIRRLIERGLASRPPSAELADRVAGWIVAAVLVVSAATALWWIARDSARALPAVVAVLIVTCPCALALATPVALTVAAGRLARAGVLPVRMASLEAVARAETAIFDKTGTVTTVSPEVARIVVAGKMRPDDALAIAAALERDDSHPVARAIASACGATSGSLECEQQRGRGVHGLVDGRRWWIGSPEYASGSESLSDAVRGTISDARKSGALVAVLSDRKGDMAAFVVEEAPRRGAAGIVSALRREGVRRCLLLSGDAPEAVARLADRLGFDEARGSQTPSDKLDRIRAEGRRSGVLFVGDGLNDAPTLAAAGASISFGHAPPLSRLASDFVVLGEDLSAVVAIRRIARRARRVLVQNIGWAVAYNALSVPLAAAGLVAPWIAAAGMSASSLLVVANAMRLARPDREEQLSGARAGRDRGAPR